MQCSLYFPHTEENEFSYDGKAPETTTTPQVQESSSTDKPEQTSNQDDTTEAEPEAKKIKSSHDTAETTEVGEARAKDEASDEEWQKIERGAVPHKVTVEDVVDESEITAAKV